MILWEKLQVLLFPPKCVLCRRLLDREETDICRRCRTDTPETGPKRKLPYLAKWTGLWYYEGTVRQSILRFKFYGKRSYAEAFGRCLAMHLMTQGIAFDVLTWVPISRLRKWRRGYDQVEQIALVAARELQVPPVPALKKIRHNRPQSGIRGIAARRANVLGVYRVPDPSLVAGKRILLLDDVLTTGATASECARTLLTAGAKEVICAALAAAPQHRNNSR